MPTSLRTLTFSLQETFAISSLRVNGRNAAFFIQSDQHTPLRPASRDIVVTLPGTSSRGRIHLDIAYAGRLQVLPEFGASHAVLSMDDQINARMVELATYSSWYPEFSVFGQPIQVDLQLALPEGWTAVCSGRKLSERSENGRSVTHWLSAKDTDIVVAAAPDYKA